MENLTLLIIAAISAALIGSGLGLIINLGKVKALRLERDRLQAFVDNAGMDFRGLRKIGQDLTRNAAAIAESAAQMVQLADIAEGTTTDTKAEAIEAIETAFSSCRGSKNGHSCYSQLYRCNNCQNTGCHTTGNTHCTNEAFHNSCCTSCGKGAKTSI